MSNVSIGEYVQEEGNRSAQLFRSSGSEYVIVMCMDGEDVVEDHICADIQTAEELAEEWVSNGNDQQATKEE